MRKLNESYRHFMPCQKFYGRLCVLRHVIRTIVDQRSRGLEKVYRRNLYQQNSEVDVEILLVKIRQNIRHGQVRANRHLVTFD